MLSKRGAVKHILAEPDRYDQNVSLVQGEPKAERLSRVIPHLCGVPSPDRLSRVLVMPRVFIDDTGSDPQALIMSLAGWASVEAWERFSDTWHDALRARPAIEYFRHYEAKSRGGEFSGWKPEDCEKKIISLAEVIADSDISYGVLTGIRNDVMQRILNKAILPRKAVRKMMRVSSSYDLCWFNITALVLQYQVNLGEKNAVDFIFDEGDTAFDVCNELWKTFKREKLLSPALLAIAGNCSEGDDKKILPLQAVDLLAGQATMRLRGHPRSRGRCENSGVLHREWRGIPVYDVGITTSH